MSDSDRAFHDSLKPSWGPDGTLIYAGVSNPKIFGRSSRHISERDGLLTTQRGAVVSEGRNVQFAKFSNEVRIISVRPKFNTNWRIGIRRRIKKTHRVDHH